MSKEANEERTPRTVGDVKEMLTKHSNGEIQRRDPADDSELHHDFAE